MQVQNNAAPVPRNRSTNYKDHEGLIVKLARKYWTRVQRAKLPGIEFEDVKGELSVAFVQAVRGYNIDAGFSFTAFFGMCAQNHINKWLGKASKEQYGEELPDEERIELEHNTGRGLGMLSLESLGINPDAMEEMADENFLDPGDRLDAIATLNRIVRSEDLLPETRAYIATLANPSMRTPRIAARINASAVQVRRQIAEIWGVKMGPGEL